MKIRCLKYIITVVGAALLMWLMPIGSFADALPSGLSVLFIDGSIAVDGNFNGIVVREGIEKLTLKNK